MIAIEKALLRGMITGPLRDHWCPVLFDTSTARVYQWFLHTIWMSTLEQGVTGGTVACWWALALPGDLHRQVTITESVARGGGFV